MGYAEGFAYIFHLYGDIFVHNAGFSLTDSSPIVYFAL
jgi:hypothetical protein